MKRQQLDAHRFGLSAAIVAAVATLLFGALPMLGMYSAGQTMMGSHMLAWIGPLGILVWALQAAIISYVCGYALIWMYNKLD